ncbi:hypothetical protein PoB_006451200 [Plakobranchus ocellatus]|uniref:Uncharacterized protein n=1 Tax=Plakobranchus ocellatus TaxID=259542 RepID=A0AAV4D1I6_9GAST|nr:hypothetical protein PoB_006451200 [Plakobranchus ocellatus]
MNNAPQPPQPALNYGYTTPPASTAPMAQDSYHGEHFGHTSAPHSFGLIRFLVSCASAVVSFSCCNHCSFQKVTMRERKSTIPQRSVLSSNTT